MLQHRGVKVPRDDRARVLAERDLARLERWIRRASVAATVGEILDEDGQAPQRARAR